MFSERCQAKAIELDWDAAVEHWRFDPVALARALDNLLNNALDHTPHGGAISVCAERGPDAQVLILRVCDTGPGVAEQVKPRLFEPFVSGRTDGMGLGLALAQEIALAHGGTARYVEQTRGACFELELPCAS